MLVAVFNQFKKKKDNIDEENEILKEKERKK
jgi:hypothetical protein